MDTNSDVGKLFVKLDGWYGSSVSEKEIGVPQRYLDKTLELMNGVYRYLSNGHDCVVPFQVYERHASAVKIVTRHFRFIVGEEEAQKEWYHATIASTTRGHPFILPPSLYGVNDGLVYVVFRDAQNQLPDPEVGTIVFGKD